MIITTTIDKHGGTQGLLWDNVKGIGEIKVLPKEGIKSERDIILTKVNRPSRGSMDFAHWVI